MRLRLSAFTACAAAIVSLPHVLSAQGARIQTGVSQGTLRESATAIPSADEVFARHVQAIGGRDAILNTTAIRRVGKMDMPAQGISALVESVAAPHKSSTRMTIPGIGDITNGFDGQVAWEVNPMRGPRIKNEKEKASAEEDADFRASMLFSRERYISVACVGQADFAGEKTWQVKTVLKSGRVVNEFFSVATGLKVGSQTTSESQSGVVNVSTLESEYKQFGPLKMATRTEMTTGGQKVVLTISDVRLEALPDSAFAAPASVKALIKP